MRDIELIKKNKLFEGISDEGINEIIDNLDYNIKIFKKGESIVEEEEEIKYLSIVLSGRGYFYKNLDNGSRLIILNLKDGDIFGEEYYNHIHYYCNGDLEAKTDMKVLNIPWRKFFKCLDSYSETGFIILKNFTRILIHKNNKQVHHLKILGTPTLRKKVAIWLMDKVKNQEKKGEIQLNSNREVFAWFLGVSRPSLSRELMRMEEDGLIQVSKYSIKIIDKNKLYNLIH